MQILGTFWAYRNITAKPEKKSVYPPLSILKPIKGLEEELVQNLNSFIDLDYPEYEIILCLDSDKDAAYETLNQFILSNPEFPIRLFIGADIIGPNPKVNNLSRAYHEAKNDWILISDSNVRVEKDYLKRMAANLTENVGVVTSVVVGKGAKEFGGDLESIFLNTFYARWMWFCQKVGNPTVIGKSMLFSKKEAERFGGLSILGGYIAEDYMAGEAFQFLGKEVRLSGQPVVQWIGHYRFKDFWMRHLRWGRIRRSQAPLLTLFEPIFYSTISFFVGAFICQQFEISNFYFSILHFSIFALGDFLLVKAENAFNIRLIPAWIFRELLAIPLFIHICSSTHVKWRGSTLKIRPGGLVTNVH